MALPNNATAMYSSKRKRRGEHLQRCRDAPILRPSGTRPTYKWATKQIYYVSNPVRTQYYDLQVRGSYKMECRFNRVGGPGYATQPVHRVGDKMIRLQNNYNVNASTYRTAVYEIVKSQYTCQNPATSKYAKYLPEEVKTFLLGEYGTQYKPKSHNRAWTIFLLGDLQYEGSLKGFEAWFEQLGTCTIETVDEREPQ